MFKQFWVIGVIGLKMTEGHRDPDAFEAQLF